MHFKQIPISFRLSITHALIMTMIMLVLSISLYKLVTNHLYNSIDSLLMSSAKYIQEDYLNPEGFLHKKQSIEKLIYKVWKKDQLPISNPTKIFKMK